MPEPLRLLVAAFAVYRLSFMPREDDGPLFVFERLRRFTDRKRREEQRRTRQRLEWAVDMPLPPGEDLGPWASLDEGVRCPYCVGFWAALAMAFLVRRRSRLGDALMLWLGLAGAQSLLEAVTKR